MSQVSVHTSTMERFINRLLDAFHDRDAHSVQKVREANHVLLLQDQYQAIAQGNFQRTIDLMADDVVLDLAMPPEIPVSGTWRGRPAVIAAAQRNFGSLYEQQAEVLSVVAQGDEVVIVAEEYGTVRATGFPYHLRWVQIYTFQGGKIVQVRGTGALIPRAI